MSIFQILAKGKHLWQLWNFLSKRAHRMCGLVGNGGHTNRLETGNVPELYAHKHYESTKSILRENGLHGSAGG